MSKKMAKKRIKKIKSDLEKSMITTTCNECNQQFRVAHQSIKTKVMKLEGLGSCTIKGFSCPHCKEFYFTYAGNKKSVKVIERRQHNRNLLFEEEAKLFPDKEKIEQYHKNDFIYEQQYREISDSIKLEYLKEKDGD